MVFFGIFQNKSILPPNFAPSTLIGHGTPCPDNFAVLREVNYFELDPIRVAKEYGVVPGSIVVLFGGIKNFPALSFDVFR